MTCPKVPAGPSSRRGERETDMTIAEAAAPALPAAAGGVHRDQAHSPHALTPQGVSEERSFGQLVSLDAARLNGSSARALLFGRFRLVLRSRELLADGVPVAIGNRALDVLIALIEACGELVTKDELLTRVWPDTTVEENNLQFQISTLRKALGPDRDFIRTVSGRGYRFVAELAVERRTARPDAGNDPWDVASAT